MFFLSRYCIYIFLYIIKRTNLRSYFHFDFTLNMVQLCMQSGLASDLCGRGGLIILGSSTEKNVAFLSIIIKFNELTIIINEAYDVVQPTSENELSTVDFHKWAVAALGLYPWTKKKHEELRILNLWTYHRSRSKLEYE